MGWATVTWTCITILWVAFAGSGVAHAADAQGTNTRPSMALPALTFATLPPATAGTMDENSQISHSTAVWAA